MDQKKLVQAIIREVLKQLKMAEPGPRVLLFGDKDSPETKAVSERLGAGCLILYAEDDPGPETKVRRILPYLSCSHMADLAMGRASDSLMEKALRALLGGREVEVFQFEYLRYAATANPALFGLYQTYATRLAEFGLRAYGEDNPSVEVENQQRVLTQEDVAAAQKKGVKALRLPQGALVTPLAADSARSAGITIFKE